MRDKAKRIINPEQRIAAALRNAPRDYGDARERMLLAGQCETAAVRLAIRPARLNLTAIGKPQIKVGPTTIVKPNGTKLILTPADPLLQFIGDAFEARKIGEACAIKR